MTHCPDCRANIQQDTHVTLVMIKWHMSLVQVETVLADYGACVAYPMIMCRVTNSMCWLTKNCVVSVHVLTFAGVFYSYQGARRTPSGSRWDACSKESSVRALCACHTSFAFL